MLTGSLSMCQTFGGLQFPLQHPPAFVALNCLPCSGAVCGKLLILATKLDPASAILACVMVAHHEWHMPKGVGYTAMKPRWLGMVAQHIGRQVPQGQLLRLGVVFGAARRARQVQTGQLVGQVLGGLVAAVRSWLKLVLGTVATLDVHGNYVATEVSVTQFPIYNHLAMSGCVSIVAMLHYIIVCL